MRMKYKRWFARVSVMVHARMHQYKQGLTLITILTFSPSSNFQIPNLDNKLSTHFSGGPSLLIRTHS